MTDPIRLVLPYEAPPLSSNARIHYRQKAVLTRQIRESAYWVAKAANIAPVKPSAVLTVWYPPDRRRRDAGSCAPTTKAAIDGLVDAGVWPDDNPTHVIEERYRIGPIDRDNPRIELHLIPASWCWVCEQLRAVPEVCSQQCATTDADHELSDTIAREDQP